MDVKSILKKITSYLKKMLSNDESVSSKRVVGFGAFVLFSAMIIVHLITKQFIQEDLILATVSIIFSCFGLNAILSYKQMSLKSGLTQNGLDNPIKKEDGDNG